MAEISADRQTDKPRSEIIYVHVCSFSVHCAYKPIILNIDITRHSHVLYSNIVSYNWVLLYNTNKKWMEARGSASS